VGIIEGKGDLKNMQAIKLEATARLERNKAHRNSLRNKGFVPAVVYGKSIASKAVAVNANKLQKNHF
jgi:ribosomal protein L25 (general stress protein Ctc)